MEAKIIADAITQVTDLAAEGKIPYDLCATVASALWELATLKDIREDVHTAIQDTGDPIWAEMAVWA